MDEIKPDDRWKGCVEFNIAPYFLGKYGYQKGLESKKQKVSRYHNVGINYLESYFRSLTGSFI